MKIAKSLQKTVKPKEKEKKCRTAMARVRKMEGITVQLSSTQGQPWRDAQIGNIKIGQNDISSAKFSLKSWGEVTKTAPGWCS